MPIYEYLCAACGQSCELIQKINDEPATECPHCHQQQLQRQVSAASFHLKGSGWYVTDFKDKKASPSEPVKSNQPTAAATEKTEAPSTHAGASASTAEPSQSAASPSASTTESSSAHGKESKPSSTSD